MSHNQISYQEVRIANRVVDDSSDIRDRTIRKSSYSFLAKTSHETEREFYFKAIRDRSEMTQQYFRAP